MEHGSDNSPPPFTLPILHLVQAFILFTSLWKTSWGNPQQALQFHSFHLSPSLSLHLPPLLRRTPPAWAVTSGRFPFSLHLSDSYLLPAVVHLLPPNLPSPGPAVISLPLCLLLHTHTHTQTDTQTDTHALLRSLSLSLWPGLSGCQSGLPTAAITIPPPTYPDISRHTRGQSAEAPHSLPAIAPSLHLALSLLSGLGVFIFPPVSLHNTSLPLLPSLCFFYQHIFLPPFH